METLGVKVLFNDEEALEKISVLGKNLFETSLNSTNVLRVTAIKIALDLTNNGFVITVQWNRHGDKAVVRFVWRLEPHRKRSSSIKSRDLGGVCEQNSPIGSFQGVSRRISPYLGNLAIERSVGTGVQISVGEVLMFLIILICVSNPVENSHHYNVRDTADPSGLLRSVA